MSDNEVNILVLTYSINFRDSDEGDCHAGDGRKILFVYRDRARAEAIATEFNPIFPQAEKERIIVPVQKFNRLLKKKFGFTIHDIDGGYDFKLEVETFYVEV